MVLAMEGGWFSTWTEAGRKKARMPPDEFAFVAAVAGVAAAGAFRFAIRLSKFRIKQKEVQELQRENMRPKVQQKTQRGEAEARQTTRMMVPP